MKEVLEGVAKATLSGLAVGAIVFGLAYTQEQFWNAIGLSLDPDWLAAGIMGALAFVIVFVSYSH